MQRAVTATILVFALMTADILSKIQHKKRKQRQLHAT